MVKYPLVLRIQLLNLGLSNNLLITWLYLKYPFSLCPDFGHTVYCSLWNIFLSVIGFWPLKYWLIHLCLSLYCRFWRLVHLFITYTIWYFAVSEKDTFILIKSNGYSVIISTLLNSTHKSLWYKVWEIKPFFWKAY